MRNPHQVFKVLNDPDNPEENERARTLCNVLENLSVLLIFLNAVLALYIEIRMYQIIRDQKGDYKGAQPSIREGIVRASLLSETRLHG
jgi:hypothetical protein|eukprot:COSAG06_NODE_4493_length_4206_cov_2.456294_4_plen_88_part_00